MYIAHFDHNKKNSHPHYLNEHVKEMREIVKGFNLTFDSYAMTEMSVILHDTGKKSPVFQAYVKDANGKRGSVQHAKGGAYALFKKSHLMNAQERFLAEFVQLIIAGHHTGLTNRGKGFFDSLKNLPPELHGIEDLSIKEVEEAISLLHAPSILNIAEEVGAHRFELYISTLVRFVMSGLVDSDYLSTESYFSKEKEHMRQYRVPSFLEFQNLLDTYICKRFSGDENNVLKNLKETVQIQALKAGGKRHTFHTLHAPTGTGKTIAALQFALHHAQKYNKSRIITALPLTNLTEEISSIYRDVFGEQHVIEDHSSTSFMDETNESIRLAAENWSRQFIVTTTVQLFESLFHRLPMKLRKLHRLTDSIIILDEYHKLPHHVLEPILQQLDVLQTHFNVTILLMSATPFPFLESKEIKKMNLLNKPKEIIESRGLYQKIPSRVMYEWERTPLSLDRLADQLVNESSVLAIVNTRKEAQELHSYLLKKTHKFEHVYYITTTMCSVHRERVLKEIKDKRNLENEKPIAVISSSILEAGIDISFPVVYRMLAPLDAIVQAAGRCNRYGEISIGRVVLFENEELARVDMSYKMGLEQTRTILEEKGVNAFTELSSFTTYYRRMFSGLELNEYDINTTNSYSFEEISKRFRMIEDKRISIVCPMVPGFKKEWLHERKTPAWWRKIQPFIVSVSTNTENSKEIDGIRVWTGQYDRIYGIKL